MENNTTQSTGGKCPFTGHTGKQTAGSGLGNREWWPNQLKLNILRQRSSLTNPMEASFNYASEFKSLDLDAVKEDIESDDQFPGLVAR